MQEEIRRLEEALEKARRAGKRQAAPFSKGEPKKNPRRPGRKPGDKHGPSTWRPIPERIDEVVDVRLPERCSHPDCQGEVEETAVVPQYQAELPPVQPRNIRFDVHVGRCKSRGHRVQGRHPRQTSDALGAAASQIGPRALAVAAELNKGLGLSYGKVQRIFAVLFGLAISRGGLCLAIQRLARKAQPTYDALVDSVRVSPMVVADETGWKVGGRLQWLWVFVTKLVTVYAIQAGRGFAEAAEILGEHYAGKLVRDGLASYRRFKQAIHQSCLGHILRRCSEILATAQGGSARVPTATKRILQKALALRDRRDQGLISPHGLAVAAGHLRAEMDRFLCWRPKVEENRKLLKHLRNERDALFTFLLDPQVPATNWAAEQAIRPAVVTRKVCGGNRTWNGALAQEILASVLQTARQQKRDPLGILVPLVCSAEPIVADALLEPIGPSDPSP
jgi:transposase